MVNTYSLKIDGEKRLSQNFKIKEFACHNGDDEILIDTELVRILQMIRDYFNVPVNIMSGYRSKKYNQSIGSSENSYHCRGMASDIQVKGVEPIQVALFCEWQNVKGIGLYHYEKDGFVHVDSRENKYYWVQTDKNGSYNGVNSILQKCKITLEV